MIPISRTQLASRLQLLKRGSTNFRRLIPRESCLAVCTRKCANGTLGESVTIMSMAARSLHFPGPSPDLHAMAEPVLALRVRHHYAWPS